MNYKIGCLAAILLLFTTKITECDSQDDPILVHDTKKHDLGSFDYCSKPEICVKYPFSVCTTFNQSTNKPFECHCDQALFDIVGVELIRNSMRMEFCKAKNLCGLPEYACADRNAKCHFTLEYDSTKRNYIPNSFCTCPKSDLTLPNRSLFCLKTCNAVCGNSQYCAQDYLTNEVTCQCRDGWTDKP